MLGVALSSDKTNISVISGNHLTHPLLISLANINANVRSKGSLHSYLLLALLPVPLFITKNSRVHGLLSDRLFHQSLDIILRPLKVAATVRVMMNDPVSFQRYCFPFLVAYIGDTPEQSLVSGTRKSVSPISTTSHKQFGDSVLHPYHTGDQTKHQIHAICLDCDPNNFINFLKFAKTHGLNGVDAPF